VAKNAPNPDSENNMAGRECNEVADTDYTAAVPLEISSEVAERADDLLREFAEDAGLSTALVVDRSGSLVAGISSESDVTIEVISALVAGASGAMRALVSQLGETGSMESLHFGEGRLVYLREIINRFILVGVSDGSRPAGLVRQKAQTVKDALSTLLRDINGEDAIVPRSVPPSSTRSLREVAMERAAQRGVSSSGAVAMEAPVEPEPRPEDVEYVQEEAPTAEIEPEPVVPEPREVLVPLDFGESEIVIEPRSGSNAKLFTGRELAAFSPFEADDDVDEDEPSGLELSSSGSIFELEEDDDDEDYDDFEESLSPDPDEELPLIGLDSGDKGIKELTSGESGLLPGNVFEMDEFDPELAEDPEDIGGEINEMIDEEDQESEVRSSGPFYF
jgi:predicted regulator of Ras-like GTPase activity (Roadblock/LC7/MglB family)